MIESNLSNSVQLPPMEVFSYDGTSQYTAGGPSACGLASVHAAVLVLSVFDNTPSIHEAVDVIRSQGFIEKIVDICSLWTSEVHLDVDDLLGLPMFAATLGTQAIQANWCGPEAFRALIRSLHRDTCSVAIITRPPEIVALFNIPSGDPGRPSVQFLFDSHPRPHLHPRGAAFIFFLNEEGPIKYLSSLFQTDRALVESRTWDASLLGQYTAHVLTLKVPTEAEIHRAIYQANIRLLEEKANSRASVAKETALSAEVSSLQRRMALQQQQIDRAMAEETASREELRYLRNEIDRLKRTASHERMPGAWVGPVSWESGTPSRASKSSSTANDHELALSLQNSYAKRAYMSSPWSFNGMRSSKEKERLNSNEGATAYGRRLQQDTREEMPRLKGKEKEGLTESSPPKWWEPSAPQRTGTSGSRSATTSGDAAQARAIQAQLDSERASYDLARRLQAEDDATRMEHQKLVREAARVKVFDCVICMDKYPEDYSAPVRGCGHVLCRNCMREHVQSQVDQAIWPVRCPLCVADKTRTGGHGVITRDLVETLGIDETLLAKWVRMEMDKVSVAVECPSCHKTTPVDVVDFRQATELTCPQGCGAHWCKQCNRTFDRGGIHSCDGQAELDQLLGQNNWKRCPACSVPVEKTYGCNNMTCRCHCRFCYVCGGALKGSTIRSAVGAAPPLQCRC